MTHKLVAGTFVIALAFAPGVARAQASGITMDPSAAITQGDGCPNVGDVSFLQVEDEFSIIFRSVKIDLQGLRTYDLAAQRSCTVRVPMSAPRGIYVGYLQQVITYGITKTGGSTASLGTRTTFFSAPLQPFSINHGEGTELTEALLIETNEELIGVGSPAYRVFCRNNRPSRGILSADLAVSGTRDSLGDSVLLNIRGLDMRFDLLITVARCRF